MSLGHADCPTNCTIHDHATPREKDDREYAVIEYRAATDINEFFAHIEHVLACDGQARVRTVLDTAAELETISVQIRERFGYGPHKEDACISFEELAGSTSGNALILIDYTSLLSDTEEDEDSINLP